MLIPLLIAFYLLFPALVIYLAARSPVVDKIGVVVICFVVGVVVGNLGLLSDDMVPLQDALTDGSVALSLPLLLFSMDVGRWVRVAGTSILSMSLAVFAIVVVASAGVPLFLGGLEEGWQVAGMAIGVYTGGTPNVAAIKAALDVDPALFVVVHSYDLIVGAIYLLFTVSVAQRFFLLFLPPFRAPEVGTDGEGLGDELESESIDSFHGIFEPRVLLGLLGAVGLSVAIVGVAVGIGSFVPKTYETAVTILTITSLGLLASFVGPIRRIPKTFQLGMYVIYVFCLVVGSMARLDAVADLDLSIIAYMTLCVFGTMTLHALLARLFRIDADTFIITSVAAVCSPPFVPLVAGALRNRTIVLSGLATGIIGYAIGNYLGISVALALRALTH